MRIGAFQFHWPSFWPIALTVATLSLLLQLANWQWQRAHEKTLLLNDFARGGAGAIPQFRDVAADRFDALRFATVEIEGRFSGEHVLFLDNRVNAGRMGYHVLGVFDAAGHDPALLVNLGWVPMGVDRLALPEVVLPEGELRFPARLKPISDPVLALGTALDVRAGGRLVMPVLDRQVVADWLHQPLLPVEALLDPSATFGYTRAWQAHYDIPPVKHRAYAFQWMALAIAVLVIFVMVNTRRASRPDDGPSNPGEHND